MRVHLPPRRGAILAYGLSALTTLLWVGCVLPSGKMMGNVGGDLATPLFREPWLLVPALLLLVVTPAGVILAQTREGLMSLLSSTDAFVALYAGFVLMFRGAVADPVSAALVSVLIGVGILSVLETVRLLMGRSVTPLVRGARLAICVLILLTPSFFLVRDGRELASLLGPFAFVALSTGGVAVARTRIGVRRTAGLLQLALAAHVFVTVRYAIFSGARPMVSVNVLGWITFGIAGGILLLALVQMLLLVRLADREGTPVAAPALANTSG